MRILISHATEDQPAAALLKELIVRCSLRQIDVWYSSDISPGGGISIGSSWFIDLHKRLSQTDAIVALITPRSIDSPWLYFETGFCASKDGSRVIPVTLGVPLARAPMPLAIYQGFDLSNRSAINSLVEKLFEIANVPYDEEMTRSMRESTASRLREFVESAVSSKPHQESTEEIVLTSASESESESESVEKSVAQIKEYIDRRFIDLFTLIPEARRPSVELHLRFAVFNEVGRMTKKFEISIDSSATVQDVFDECFFQITDLVEIFTYMHSWIIEDHSGTKFAIREISNFIPAGMVFKTGSSYSIRILPAPYDPRHDPRSQ